MKDDAANSEEFFVGFFKTPPRLKRWLAIVALIVLAISSGLAFALYHAQSVQPETRWIRNIDLTGVLQLEPYPIFHVADIAAMKDLAGKTVLLTSIGKIGVDPEHYRELDGQAITVGGAFLERGDARLLQVPQRGKRAITAVESGQSDAQPPAPASLGTFRLRGEIVDQKCFMGAMKPGQGRVHQGCAALCLLGKVPPVFITYHSDGFTPYLLADETGRAIPESVLNYVGDAVSVNGEVERHGTLLVLKIDAASILRI